LLLGKKHPSPTMADIGRKYTDLETLAAGGKSNLKKRIATPDIFPDPKRVKVSDVTASARSVSAVIADTFVPPVASGIRSGTSQQLLKQLGDMNGNVPSMANAHVPIHVICPKFRASKYFAPVAEEGELAMAFHLSDSPHSSVDKTIGGGIRLMNWQLASLTLAPGKVVKEGYESMLADLNLMNLDNPLKITEICALIGPVYIPKRPADEFMHPKTGQSGVASQSDTRVQVIGLAEGRTMKNLWPEAPVNSQLFLELRKVEFDLNTTFHFSKPGKLEKHIFPDKRSRMTYQFVPTFVPPSLQDYMDNHARNPAYTNPANYKVPVGKLLFHERDGTGKKMYPSPSELARGMCWSSCGRISVMLSTHMYWHDPIVHGAAASAAAASVTGRSSLDLERRGQEEDENTSTTNDEFDGISDVEEEDVMDQEDDNREVFK